MPTSSSTLKTPSSRRLFLSYRTRHASLVRPLIDALEAQGIEVWSDAAIDDGASITGSLREALAGSHALAVFATDDYAESQICAWELASAWIAAAYGKQAQQRVIILLPAAAGSTFDPRGLGPLADSKAFALPAMEDPTLAQTAAEIAANVLAIDPEPLGHLLDVTRETRWYPYSRAGSVRFIGRMTKLWELHGLLTRTRVVGITGAVGRELAQVRGLGGVGKTLLAVEYARRFEVAWPGGIFWVDADPSLALAATPAERLVRRRTMLISLAASLGVATDLDDPIATAAAVERAIDQRADGQPFLWIIDNLPPGTDQALVEALSPANPMGALLLTTRWMALEGLPGRLDLDVLDDESAYTLLTERHPPIGEGEEGAARALLVEVGNHPLAVDVLGALIMRALSTTPYASWKRRLAHPEDHFTRAADGLHEELPTGCSRAITRVLASSFSLLEAPLAEVVLRATAFLADAPIPGDFLLEVIRRLAPMRLVSSSSFEAEVEHAVDELAAHALVRHEVEVGGIRVHAVVRYCARHFFQTSPGASREAESRICDVLWQRLNHVDDLGTHVQLLQLIPHAETFAGGDSEAAVCICGSLGNFLERRGDFRAAFNYASRALQFYRVRGIKSSGETAQAKINIGVAKWRLGELEEAECYFGEAMVEASEHFGPEHPQTLHAASNLALAFAEKGANPAARELLDQVLQIRRRDLGNQHLETLRTMTHLGNVLSDLGEHAESRRLLEAVVATGAAVLGPDNAVTILGRAHLSTTLVRLGDLVAAREHAEAALDVHRRLLGLEHPATLRSARHLADIYQMQGEHVAARGLREESLVLQRRVLGPMHPDTLSTGLGLGMSLISAGALDEAEDLLEEALAGFATHYGDSHPYPLLARDQLGRLCRLRGDLEGARQQYQQLFEGRFEALGSAHSGTMEARGKLADVLVELGRPEEATPHVLALQALRSKSSQECTHNDRTMLGLLPLLEEKVGLREPADRASPREAVSRRSRRRRRPP